MENKPESLNDKLSNDIVNAKDIERLFRMDGLFIQIFEMYGAPPNWSRPQGFVSLSKIILEQQVSLASANAHFLKLNQYLGDFTPDNILQLTDEEMRMCQVSRQKATYLRALSEALNSNSLDLDKLGKLKEDEVRSQLTDIKGIGKWTSDIYLMFCLQSKNIFPVGDIAIVHTVRELTEAKSREEILQQAEKWKPIRSLASYFLWHYYLKKRNRPSE